MEQIRIRAVQRVQDGESPEVVILIFAKICIPQTKVVIQSYKRSVSAVETENMSIELCKH